MSSKLGLINRKFIQTSLESMLEWTSHSITLSFYSIKVKYKTLLELDILSNIITNGGMMQCRSYTATDNPFAAET